MIHIVSQQDLAALLNEINKLDFTMDGSRALMAYKQSAGLPNNCPKIIEAVTEIANTRKATPIHVMVNRLPAGVVVPMHTDRLKDYEGTPDPHFERWHLSVTTNERCWYNDGAITTHMAKGCWCGPILYWREHSVINHGTTERIHLVVDLLLEGRFNDNYQNMS